MWLICSLLGLSCHLAAQETAQLMVVDLDDVIQVSISPESMTSGVPQMVQQGNYQRYPSGSYQISSTGRSSGQQTTTATLETGLRYTAAYGPGSDGMSRWHVLPDHNLSVDSFTVQWAHFAPAAEAQNISLAFICDGVEVRRSESLSIGAGTSDASALSFLYRDAPSNAAVCWFVAENGAGIPLAQSVRIPTALGLRLRMFLVGRTADDLEMFTTIQALPPIDPTLPIDSQSAGLRVQETAGESVYFSPAGDSLNGFVFDFDAEGLPRWNAFATDAPQADVAVSTVTENSTPGTYDASVIGSVEISPHPCSVTLRSATVMSARTRSSSPVQQGNRLQAVACGGVLTP